MGKGTDRLVTKLVDSLPDGFAEDFARSPKSAITAHLGLTVDEAEHLNQSRPNGGHCDGVSFLEHGVILYAKTRSKRENFTLAHEVGHWAIERVEGVYDWVAGQREPLIVLENLCDRLAQALLLPQSTIDATLGIGPLRAHHILELHRSTLASRAAACIALSTRLPSAGAVAYASRETGAIEYASIQPHPEHGWPTVYPWPGQAIRPGSALLGLGDGQMSTRLSTWYSPWRTQAEYFVDAIADDTYIYAVFSEANLWGVKPPIAVPEFEYDKRPRQTIECCGQTRQVRGYPCNVCGSIPCSECGLCAHEKLNQADKPCKGCWLLFTPHLLNDEDLCEECAPTSR